MGYKSLGIKAQNLRDQAARLEGLQEFSVDTSSEEGSRVTNGLGNSQLPIRISEEDNNQNSEKQGSPLNDGLNLHKSQLQVSGEQPDFQCDETIDESPFAEVLSSLLEFPTLHGYAAIDCLGSIRKLGKSQLFKNHQRV